MQNTAMSHRVDLLCQSEIRNMSVECDRVGGINLAQGICDLPLQNVLREAVEGAMKQGENHYTNYRGIDALREQIARKAHSFNGIKCDSEQNVIVSAGATGALYCACYALFEPQDEVILFQPYYGYHMYTLQSLNLVPILAHLTSPDWSIDMEELQALVTPKTRAILICTPSNPCGKVFTEQELDLLADFAIENDLIVLTDEIYEYITYDNRKHISPGSLEKIKDRTVTISGYSKTFSITGWRIGYSIASKEITDRIGLVNDLIYVCAPAPLQYGVAEAIKRLGDSYYESLREEFVQKRDLICSALQQSGLEPIIPQGAYYVLADISALPGETSHDKAMWLLNKIGVCVVPGDAFYIDDTGSKLARFCFAKDMSVLKEACERISSGSKEWRRA